MPNTHFELAIQHMKQSAQRLNPGLSIDSDAADVVIDYHTRTKHTLQAFARGPETLDWTEQPNPFREYVGCTRIALPLNAHRLATAFKDLSDIKNVPAKSLSCDALATLLELSMGLSAWKEYGPDRWALRCNPSSGNLHPTEAYVITADVMGIADGVYHYVSRDHVLEQRCSAAANSLGGTPQAWIALSSIHWREVWKYGERAFRYCQLDIGHAIGALHYAAAALGWQLRVVESCDDVTLSRLLGLQRDIDFGNAERESPDVLLAIIPDASNRNTLSIPQPTANDSDHWHGKANVLDPHKMYHWPIIDSVATASVKAPPNTVQSTTRQYYYPEIEEIATRIREPLRAVDVIRSRRSAQHFDSKFTLAKDAFFQIIDSAIPRHHAPWDIWSYAPRIHLLLFVHRVEGVAPGLYVLPRRTSGEMALQRALPKEFLWRKVEDAPRNLPLRLLALGDFRQISKALSCRQAIASDSCFSLCMLAEFDSVSKEPWRYRQLHWEAGLIGQALYLHAEALSLRGTGIGCYFDDAVHKTLGLKGQRYQSLYHFTIGRAVMDERIRTDPPYAHLNDRGLS
jgi:SagB-type dehydrogenase family enzyme